MRSEARRPCASSRRLVVGPEDGPPDFLPIVFLRRALDYHSTCTFPIEREDDEMSQALQRLKDKERIKVLFVRPPHHYWPILNQSDNFLVPLTLQPDAMVDVYLKIRSTSSLGAPLTLWDYDHYFDAQQPIMVGQGLYYGIIVVMVLYNLFIYVSVRHVSYLYYIGAALGCFSKS